MYENTFNTSSRDLSYVRKVYAWLGVGALLSSLTAWASLHLGEQVYVQLDKSVAPVSTPSMVAGVLAHPYLTMFLMVALVAVAAMVRRIPGVSAVAYFLFTAAAGFFVGPALFFAQWKAAHYATLSANPIRDAFLMTMTLFLGLTTYTWVAKRDFSWLGGMLFTGLWVVIGATILGFFLNSRIYELAVDSVAVILFSGFILFDTQRVLEKSDGDDAIGDALNLYLDILNIFIRLLGILSSSKDD